MSEQMVKIDKNAFCGTESDYDNIEYSITKLCEATEDQFKKIKKENWFKRFFSLITFSKKNEKNLAELISNLAQAQEIMLQILLRLAVDDAKISDMVLTAMKDIKRLSEQDLKLRLLISDLENVILGYTPDIDIKQLTETEKKVLSACLYMLSDISSSVTDLQRKYANIVVVSNCQISNIEYAINKIPYEKKRVIFNCCLEYLFLGTLSHEYIDNSLYKKFLENFDIGQKSTDGLQHKIDSLYKLKGVEGFYTKYLQETFVFVDNEFLVDFEIEKTDLLIKDYKVVEKETETLFENKSIRFSSYIKCEGRLLFKNCTIIYGAEYGGIEVAPNGEIHFENCEIMCECSRDKHFVECFENSAITLSNCNIYGASKFVSGTKILSLDLYRCKLINSFSDCITLNDADNTKCVVSNSKFQQIDMEKWQVVRADNLKKVKIIDIHNSKSNEQNGCFEFSKNEIIIEENCKLQFAPTTERNVEINWITGVCTNVADCIFKGINTPLNVAIIETSKFVDCKNCLILCDNAKIKKCIFENCTYVIVAHNSCEICNCEFNRCYDTIINQSGEYGGIKVEYCDFNEIENPYSHSINLKVGDKKGTQHNEIKKCRFKTKLLDNLLVNPVRVDKCHSATKVIVESCDFSGVRTRRQDGKVVKKSVEYKRKISFSGKSRTKVIDAVDLNNCRGVNQDGIIDVNFNTSSSNEGESTETVKPDYDEKSLFNKILSCITEAGEQLIKNVLSLYYVSISENCPLGIMLAIFGAISYFISPLDAVPDMTPVIGYVDDASVVGAVVAMAEQYIDENIISKAEQTYNEIFN